tara:strand:- start:14864 stop:16246 length:1383 start_codon:yes stop_codon:yes gene_type:complete
MNRSLGSRLLLILLGVNLFVWLIISAGVWVLGMGAIERQVDNQLRTLVSTVSYTIDALITAGFPADPGISLLDYEIVDSSGGDVYMVALPDEALPMALNVWHGDVLRAMSRGSPLFESTQEAGITNSALADGSEWRVIRSRLGDTGLWLIAGFNTAVLGAESKRLLFAMLSPLLLGLLLIVPLIYYAVSNGLKPLRKLEQQILQRSSNDLHPVETSGIPTEVVPVVSALNGLLQQLNGALKKEKRITADAAHELQTPLAAIKTEVQLALNHSHGADSALLLRIIERVNRASHAVRQLTALSRLESTAQPFTHSVDLAAIVGQVLEAYREELASRRLISDIERQHPLIQGNADMIRILVDNLVRNAVNHSMQGSPIHIRLSVDSVVSLHIENQCREISEQEWQLITQRFYRVPGSQGDGSGLGMSIAQRICELHGAAFSVGKRDDGGGFRASVVFPRPGFA